MSWLAVTTGCRPRTEPVRLWLGGDVHLGADRVEALVDSTLANTLGSATGVVNLEGPVAAGPAWEDRGAAIILRNPPDAGRWLAESNVGFVTLANNHAQDLGKPGSEATTRALISAGLSVATPQGHARIAGGDVAVLARDLTDGIPPDLGASLARAHQTATWLVVSFHVTGPPSYLPRPDLRTAVDLAVESGADVVVVHGSHVLGPVERRGDTVIAWGLGNLVFGCPCTRETEGLLLQVEFQAGKAPFTQVLPITAGLDGTPARLAPSPHETWDLLEALGSSPLVRHGNRARL